jgi:hypothetical protein
VGPILLATDGSGHAGPAAERATERAGDHPANLLRILTIPRA